MKFTLRLYQENTVSQIRKCFTRHKTAILCIPTGGGKTVVFSHISRSAIDKGGVVMIACDRKELITQAYDKLKDYGLYPTIIAPGKPFVKNTCYVASVDTLLRRGIMLDIDVLIVDEAHKTKFDKLVDKYRGKCYVIGATATPIRKGSQASLHLQYHDLVNPVQVSDLIGEGFLSPAVTYGAEVDLESIQTNKLDYDNKELFNLYNKQVMYKGVVDKYEQYCKGYGLTIVFCVNVEHSINTAKEFQERGIDARHIDGSMSDFRRSQLMNQFKYAKFPVLVNCMITTTGYDNPLVFNTIIDRATLSLSLWLQMCGRSARVLQGDILKFWREECKRKGIDYVPKTHHNIIDMGSNVKKHGFWEDDREWNLVKKPKSKLEQPAPVKECKQCEALIHASKPVCPHCGFVFPKVAKVLGESEFTLLTRKNIPPHLRKPYRDMDLTELHEYANIKGYKTGWAYMQMKLRETNQVITKRKLG